MFYSSILRYATDGRGVPSRATIAAPSTISDATLYGSTSGYISGVDGLTGPVFSISELILATISNIDPNYSGATQETSGGLTGGDEEDLNNLEGQILEELDSLYGKDNNFNSITSDMTYPPIFATDSEYSGGSDSSEAPPGGMDLDTLLYNDVKHQLMFHDNKTCYPGKGFAHLGINYNPQATMILGITHPGAAGGGTPGFVLGETGAQVIHSGATGQLQGTIYQVLDLATTMTSSGNTYVSGVPGSITGGVYALFIGKIGPTGGTSGRGVTQYVAGGTFATSPSNSGITGLISYVHPIVDSNKSASILSTIKRYYDRQILSLSMNVTGGSGGSTIYSDGSTSPGITFGKAFVIGVKPNTVSQLADMCLVGINNAKHANNFQEVVKFVSVPSASTGGNESDINYTHKKIYADKLSSSTATTSGASALEELHYKLNRFQNIVDGVRSSVFSGTTGGSVNTLYKIQNALTIINSNITNSQ